MQENSSNQAKKISDARQQSLTPNKLTKNNIKPNNLSTKSISQNTKDKKTSKRGKAKKNKHLTIHSRTLTLALKFYPEQMMTNDTRQSITNIKTGRIDYSLWTSGNLIDQAKAYLNERIKNFSTYFNSFKSKQDKSKRHWEVEAICHDKDEVANPNDMFAPGIIKPHFHVIIRDSNGNRFFVETVLKALGLNYQKDDSKLFYEHGCTTVANFNAYSMYLTHETVQAQKDGKELYDLSEVMTNMSLDELKDVRAGYSRLQAKSKLTESDWNDLADYVAKLGDEMKDFEAWAKKSLSFVQRTSKKFKDLQVLYNQHLLDAVEKSPDLIRCCILISGRQNDGKSYTARHALQKMGETVYNARSSTGKYDGLSSRATAMIFDDRKMTDALNVTDNRATVLHSRGTGNDRPWLGKYVVITTNLQPDAFFSGQVMYASQISAIKSRFYTTSLMYDGSGRGRLVLLEPSTRGTKEDIAKRNQLYTDFADHFNDLIKDYTPLSADNAPQLDKSYYKDAQLHHFGSSNADELLNDTVSLYDQNQSLSSKIGNLISLLCTKVDGLSNKIFYTGMINSTCSYEYPQFIEFLHEQNPDAKVYKEDADESSCTVAEFLKKLPTPTTLDDYKFDNDDKFELNDCEYIRVE